MAAVAGPLLENERRKLNKRGRHKCGCGRPISATRVQCRACAES